MFYEFNTPLERFRVDEHNGIIYGVSIITAGVTARGHDLEVDLKTLAQMKECAEKNGQVPVKWNHRSGADAVAGYLKNFRIEGKKLKGDWHLLRSHERYNHAIELAREMPSCVGLSAAFTGDDDAIPGSKKKLARCDELISVDLVASPAANPDGMLERGDLGGRENMGDAEWRKLVVQFDAPVDTQTQNEMNSNSKNPAGDGGELQEVLSQLQTLNTNISSIGQRLDAVEQFSGQVNDYLVQQNDPQNMQNDPQALIDELMSYSPEQLEAMVQNGDLTAEDVAQIQAMQAEGAVGDGGAGDGDGYQAGELAGAGVGDGGGGEAATALSAMHRELKELRSRVEAKEMAEERDEYEVMLSTIEKNMQVLAARNEELSTQLETSRHALRTSGARALRPAHGARLFEEKVVKKNEFEARVSQLVVDGKKRGEAVMLAAKESPDAYATYLSGRGLVKSIED